MEELKAITEKAFSQAFDSSHERDRNCAKAGGGYSE
jgi:hypothetical protein